MQKDMTFLAVDGKLTSSSAAHLRNLAKEKAEELLAKLRGANFLDKYVQLIGTSEKNCTDKGWDAFTVSAVPEVIEIVAKYHAFEAWMNEAIEAKRHLYDELKRLSINTWAKLEGIELPVEPEMEKVITSDDCIAELTIKERNRFFALQAKVAALGKLLHNDGYYVRAMGYYQNALSKPISEVMNGRDTILHISEPSVSAEVVNETFFILQNMHREAQAQLNGMAHAIEEAIEKDELAKTTKYREAYSAYANEMKEMNIKFSEYKQKLTAELEKLKIVIPEHLTDVYTELTSLGKK